MFSPILHAQYFKVSGKITNNRLEPLALVTIQVKDLQAGVITKEDGTYELNLEEGKYDLIISMMGFKTQIITLTITKIISRTSSWKQMK
ncbi:MAG: carboxypeptidase-like regulatory domain-containing protein [Bacteroidota bacterium]